MSLETKSPEEIQCIKAANLARIKKVFKQLKNTEEKHHHQPDSFGAPAFLTKQEVKWLV
jgi:hypothetical protein